MLPPRRARHLRHVTTHPHTHAPHPAEADGTRRQRRVLQHSTHARERASERARASVCWGRACVGLPRPEEEWRRATGVEHGVWLGSGRRVSGGRVQPGPGQRPATAAGRAGAGDRDGAAVCRDGGPGAVQGEAQRAAAGPAGCAIRHLGAEGGGRALRPDPLPHPGGHWTAP